MLCVYTLSNCISVNTHYLEIMKFQYSLYEDNEISNIYIGSCIKKYVFNQYQWYFNSYIHIACFSIKITFIIDILLLFKQSQFEIGNYFNLDYLLCNFTRIFMYFIFYRSTFTKLCCIYSFHILPILLVGTFQQKIKKSFHKYFITNDLFVI